MSSPYNSKREHLLYIRERKEALDALIDDYNEDEIAHKAKNSYRTFERIGKAIDLAIKDYEKQYGKNSYSMGMEYKI